MRLLLCLMLCAGVLAEKRRYDGHRIVSVYSKTTDDIKVLHGLEMEASYEELDFWSGPSRMRPTDIRVSPNDFGKLESTLRAAGIGFNITNENIQIGLDLEEEYMRRPLLNTRNLPYQCDFMTKYCTFDEINEIVDYFAGYNNPAVQVEVTVIGYSYQNQPIRQVKIARNLASPKESIFLEAATHAREWVTVPAVLSLMERIVFNLDSDTDMMLDKFDWYIVPVHNPDGYIYSHTNERLWRKNRFPCGGNRFGVDLNRNWGAAWGGLGTSSSCSSDIYTGSSSFSEPETTALFQSVQSVQRATGSVYAFFAVHSYSEMIIIPYAYTQVKPNRYNELLAATIPMIEELYKVPGSSGNWLVGTAPDILSYGAGGSDDFFYHLGVPFSYTYELRPQSWNPGFELPPSQIGVATEEFFHSLKGFAAQPITWPNDPTAFPEPFPDVPPLT